MLFLTAGIVFLTLVVNASSTKKLMELLNLTRVSESRMMDVENALKILQTKRALGLAALKQNRFVCDADWSTVEEMSKIVNPYGKEDNNVTEENYADTLQKLRVLLSKILSGVRMTQTKCPVCESQKKTNMTLLEYQELAEEARLRVLKALKVSDDVVI
jgi:sodium/hydrogen exchanger 10/11